MSGELEVLIHHSVAGIFGDGLARELHEETRARLPDAEIRLSVTADESAAALATADAVMTVRPFDDSLDAADRLRWIQVLTAGVDRYDLGRLRERGVLVTNASGVAARPIAEQVLGYLLVFERRIHRGIRQQARGVWRRYSAGELGDKTVGIVGVGAIGREVARLTSAFGTTVVGTKRDLEDAPETLDAVYPPAELDTLLARSDYVVLACPLTPETTGLIGAEELLSMRSDAVLVNVARGAVVDEAALTVALQQGRIRGAALDVFDVEPLPPASPLWDLPNVVVTPHMAGMTERYAERCADLFAENARRLADGAELANRVA